MCIHVEDGKMSDRESASRSFTIAEWCERRRISKGVFYKLAQQGRAPLTHNAGAKRLISGEADEA
jgi:hypothetical protein